jgi:putative endopeptidase
MGGLKAVLLVAKDVDGFDYQRFFKAYVIGWQSVGSAASSKDQFLTDSHPLDATRANVSVMQVQEFYDTYGIKAGDTMYLAPEDRISVW